MAEALDGVRRHAEACSNAADPEVVHQLRVSVRKLRVFLLMFKRRIGAARTHQLRQELRRLFLPLGELRDLQLFKAAVFQRITHNTPGSVELLRRLRKQIRTRRMAIKTMISSESFRYLVQNIAALVRTPALQQPGRGWFKRRLEKRRRRAVKTLRRIDSTNVDALHGARKALKTLRYTCELSRGHFREKQVRGYLRALKRVQEPLGAIIDLHVQLALTEKECCEPALRRQLTTQLGKELKHCMASIDARLSDVALAKSFWG